MTYEKEIKLDGAILNQSNLAKLMGILENIFPNVKMSIEFKNDTKLSSIEAEEFKSLSFQNKNIKKLNIRGNIYKDGRDASVSIRESHYYSTYIMEFDFSDYEQYIKFSDTIDNWILEVSDRKKYIKLFYSWFSFAFCFVVVFVPFLFWASKENFVWQTAVLWFLPSAGISGGITAALKYAFPLTEIDMGVNRNKIFRKFLWLILSLLVIPTILSLIF